VREEAIYPDIPGDAAIDGTGTHLLLEQCILDDVSPESLIGTIIGVNHIDKSSGWLVDAERAARVQECLSYLDRRTGELEALYPGGIVTVETESRSDPGGMFGRTDWQGTCDITITMQSGERVVFIEVVDYKDGRGFVAAEGNTQLLSYLGGKLRPHIASRPDLVRPFYPARVCGVRMTIVQPKTNPTVRYWDIDTTDAVERLEKLAWSAHETDRPDAPLIPGKHCAWCKHKSNCSAQSERDLEKVRTMTTDIMVQDGSSLFEVIESTFGDITTLDDKRLADLADAEAGINAVFERVKAELEKRLESGSKIPGYTLAPGRGSNVWALPEEDVVKALKARKFTKDDIYPPKLISPAQVLKSNKLTADQKKRIERDYISFKAGAVTLKKVAREEQSFEEKVALFKEPEVQLPVQQTTTYDFL